MAAKIVIKWDLKEIEMVPGWIDDLLRDSIYHPPTITHFERCQVLVHIFQSLFDKAYDVPLSSCNLVLKPYQLQI